MSTSERAGFSSYVTLFKSNRIAPGTVVMVDGDRYQQCYLVDDDGNLVERGIAYTPEHIIGENTWRVIEKWELER